MGKRTIVGVAMSALIVGVVVATLLPATGKITGKTFTLCEKDSHDYEADVDNPPKHFSAGDTFIFSEPEFDTNGDRVGKSFGVGNVIRLNEEKNDGTVALNVSLRLKGGDIEIQSTTKFSQFGKGHPVAIVGGTGRYNDASGVIQLFNQPCAGVSKKGDHLQVVLN
jgi:hypothetical protein